MPQLASETELVTHYFLSMTTTQIISQSFGTSTNIGDFLSPVKTTLQSSTTAAMIAVRVTLTNVGANASSRLFVWCAVSPINYSTALAGCQALKGSAQYVEMLLDPKGIPTVDLDRSSDVDITAGGYHYCWLEAPTLLFAATATVNLQELP